MKMLLLVWKQVPSMAKYVSKKMGAIIETNCVLSGDWVLFEPQSNPEVKEVAQIEVKEVPADDPLENDAQFKNINIEQIKQELDAFGVKYDPKAKKKELYDLMLAQGK